MSTLRILLYSSSWCDASIIAILAGYLVCYVIRTDNQPLIQTAVALICCLFLAWGWRVIMESVSNERRDFILREGGEYVVTLILATIQMLALILLLHYGVEARLPGYGYIFADWPIQVPLNLVAIMATNRPISVTKEIPHHDA